MAYIRVNFGYLQNTLRMSEDYSDLFQLITHINEPHLFSEKNSFSIIFSFSWIIIVFVETSVN